jgi:hypothetical protein
VPLPDLITLDYAQAQLAAGGRVLTAAQTTALPSKITEASAAVRRWCGDRDFTRTTYDEAYRPSLDGMVDLRQFPVNKVLRVSGGRTTGIAIANTSTTTNLRPTAGFTSTGDEATGLTFTGLALVATTGGVDVEIDVPYSASPTLGQLAASVNALGNGWQATVPASLTSWPSADLVGGDVAQDATGTGAELKVFAEVIGGCRVDRRTGELKVGIGGGSSSVDGPRWGPYQDPADFDWPGKVRVVYDAGFDAIPDLVQQGTAIVVGKYLDDLARDLAITSETIGRGNYTVDPNRAAELPPEAREKLALFRIPRT